MGPRAGLHRCGKIYRHYYYYFFIIIIWTIGLDSSVGTATRYGLDGPGFQILVGECFSALVQTVAGGPPSLLYNEYRLFFPGGKAAGA